MARRLDRSEPAIERAGFVFITGTALLLLVSASQAWAEDEPAARAPLPPPRSAPAETGERQKPNPAAHPNQSDPRSPAIRLDRPKSQSSERKPRLHFASGKGAAKKRATLRLANRSIAADSRRQHHRAAAFERSPGRERSPTEAGIGHLSPPRDYPGPRLRSTTEALPEPPQAPLYYPNYFGGPPAYGYAPSYPYGWAPPRPGVFR